MIELQLINSAIVKYTVQYRLYTATLPAIIFANVIYSYTATGLRVYIPL